MKIIPRHSLVFLSVFVMLSCTSTAPPAEISRKASITVEAAVVNEQAMVENVSFNGVTQFQFKENIRSQATGYISEIPHTIGDRVQQGQAIAYVRTKEQNVLRNAGEIDPAFANMGAAQRINTNTTGTLVTLTVAKNDYVSEGDVLGTVAQSASLVVRVNVPYAYIDKIAVGTLCDVVFQDGSHVNAKVTKELPQVDPIAQAQAYLIQLPPDRSPEALNVQVSIPVDRVENAMVVPCAALQTDELMTKFWVLRIGADSIATRIDVARGMRNDSLVQITSDHIKAGDLVVTEGSYEMQDSTKVSVLGE